MCWKVKCVVKFLECVEKFLECVEKLSPYFSLNIYKFFFTSKSQDVLEQKFVWS